MPWHKRNRKHEFNQIPKDKTRILVRLIGEQNTSWFTGWKDGFYFCHLVGTKTEWSKVSQWLDPNEV